MRKLFNSQFRVTQGFGVNAKYYKQFGLRAHEGADIIPKGSDWTVFSLEDGVVVKDDDEVGSISSDPYGKTVTIWHPLIKKATMYCHLAFNTVSLGQNVKMGDKIGIMGTTGNSSGAHIHLNLFDVDDNGVRLNKDNGYLGGIDPLPFLEQELKTPVEEVDEIVINDQTKIKKELLGGTEDLEVQQIRGKLGDLKRAEFRIIELETTKPSLANYSAWELLTEALKKLKP